MKNILLILTAICLTTSSQANACPRTEQKLICPGDKVVDNYGHVGRVSGINPFKQTVSISFGGYTDSIRSIASTSVTEGCLEGYCVGDFVVDYYGYRGKIDAVNPYNRTIAINFGGTSDSIREIESVSLGLGCMMGYCVGDFVIDDNGHKGKINAINRFRATAAINYGGVSDGIKKITSLSTSQYCTTYGREERELNVYPIIIESHYPSTNFKYTLKRPVK